MTFKIQGPVTQGYGDIVNQSGKVLGQIPGWEDQIRYAALDKGLAQAALNKIQHDQLEMMKLGVQSQQPQKEQGGTDWLGLATKGLSIAGGLGAFGGGGGGAAANYSPTGAPGFGAENVDWMSMPGYFGNPG